MGSFFFHSGKTYESSQRVLFFPLWMGAGGVAVAGFHVAQAGLTLPVAETDSKLPSPLSKHAQGEPRAAALPLQTGVLVYTRVKPAL